MSRTVPVNGAPSESSACASSTGVDAYGVRSSSSGLPPLSTAAAAVALPRNRRALAYTAKLKNRRGVSLLSSMPVEGWHDDDED